MVKREVVVSADGNESYDKDLKPAPCTSVEELVADLIPKLKLPPPTVDCLKVGLAVVLSLKIPGPMLWVHFVGQSSSLKTTLARLISAAFDKCYSVSHFNGLYSGYRTNGQDNSLVPKLQNKVLVINDLTPLLQAEKSVQNEVFGDMRDIYEGTGSRHFKNGFNPQYSKIVFGCITCTTDAIRQFSRSDLGERFLMSEINADYDDQGRFRPVELDLAAKGSAYDNVFDTIADGLDEQSDDAPSLDNLAPERAKCWGLINHLYEWLSDESSNLANLARAFKANVAFKSEVEALAIWMEHARCPVPKKTEDLSVRQRPALPHRSIKQLGKLALTLCVVEKSLVITDEVRRIVRNKAFDTGHGFPLEIMNYIASKPGTSKEILALKLNLSPTRTDFICDHLITIGVLARSSENNGTGRRGRNAVCYSLTPEFRQHADVIGLKPIASPSYEAPKKKTLRDVSGKAPSSLSLLRNIREGKAS